MCTCIVNAIERDGPMPFTRYMQMALYEPGLGYYVNGLLKFGSSGDFITAPESGDLFAHALARTIDRAAESLGPDWTMLELGPGSGALAAGLVEHLERPPAHYLLLEPSAMLREVQRERLDGLMDDGVTEFEWIERPPDADFHGVIVGNEVMDALPVERFEVRADGFDRLCVTTGERGFEWARRPADGRLAGALAALNEALDAPLAPGYQSELCVDLPDWLATVLAPLKKGLALLVDYGYRRHEFYHPDRREGTLVCHYRHRAHFDPFVWPGLTDLSAFVDFSAAAEAGQALGFDLLSLCNQADFLLASGVHSAIEDADDDLERLRLAAEFKRLVLPGEMGEKFKLLALGRGLPDDFGDLLPPSRLSSIG
ncbi:MAG: SAM-dependent methyltransferase [Wenzhouxiangellaceae bacterium]|nr:SAM-dependent methyltransferase [Wenzhouxiangellaceae bacterium]